MPRWQPVAMVSASLASAAKSLPESLVGSLAAVFSLHCCSGTGDLESHIESVDFPSPMPHFREEEPVSPSLASSSCPSDDELEESCLGLLPEGCEPEELAPWLRAAEDFEMNTDFDVSDSLPDLESGDAHLTLEELMAVMKSESAGKRTIQALGDKILLGKLLGNLGIPQMPCLFETYSEVQEEKVAELVKNMEESPKTDAFDIVVKPTHLSNGTGALILSASTWEKEGYGTEKLKTHMESFLKQCAADSESEALRSLVPGFIVQPRYRSCLDFGFPLELRVVTLWGKARLGIWWWGRPDSPGKPQRSTWFVRKQRRRDALSQEDGWEAIHNHPGGNVGFETALGIFNRAMPAMAVAAEAIAVAVGAPFLRSDFFLGSSTFGVRLNEVAYGSGVDYKRLPSVGKDLADDGPAIARILQQGHAVCKKHSPDHFLSSLGAVGSSYTRLPPEWWEWWRKQEDGEYATSPAMAVADLPTDSRKGLPDWVQLDFDPIMLRGVKSVSSSGCQTPRQSGSRTPQVPAAVSAAAPFGLLSAKTTKGVPIVLASIVGPVHMPSMPRRVVFPLTPNSGEAVRAPPPP